MRKLTITIIALNILFVLGAAMITLFFLAAIRDESERLARVEQEQAIQTFWQLLRAKGTDFRIVNGRLMAGDYVLNGNFELPDTIQSIFGGTATVFMGDTRVSTNIRREDGTRAMGTKLTGPAHDAIFRHNRPYRGEALILGIPYFTAYDPIRNSRGETIGVLYVGARKNEFFSRYERYKVNVIAGAAVISTIFAVLAVVLLRERKRHVEELQENETKYRTLFENSAEGILILDNGIFDCNEQLCRLFGRSRADILGKSPVHFSPELQPDGTPSGEKARMLIDSALAGEARLFPWRHQKPDGTPVDTEVSLKALTIRGRTVLQAVVRDVTERKRAEEALRVIRLQQQAMLDNIPDLVWLKDTESRFIAVNAAFAKACGTTPAELTGKNDLDIWPADLAALYREDDARVMASGEQIRTEEPLVDAQGKRTWIETIKMPVYDETGTVIGTTGIARDISKRREAELKLRENEARLAKAQRIAHVGNWEWDIVNNTVLWSDEIFRIFGIPPNQPDITYETFLHSVHPDDRQTVIDAIDAALYKGAPYDIVHRVVCPDGGIRHVREQGEVEFNTEGSPVRMQGVVKDITESTLAEAALRESEARFRELFEQNEDAIILLARESLDVIDANRAAESLLGRDKESLAWLGPWSFIAAADYNSFIGAVPPSGDATPFHLDRIGVVRCDGTRLIASIWGKIIRLRDTEVVYCSIRDKTERIHMEEEARIAQSRLIHANKMTSLGVLVSGIAHEINNPNTFIQGNATLIESFWRDALPILDRYRTERGDFTLGGLPYGEVERIIPRLVHGVKEGSRRISAIVSNLKDFAREDTAKAFMPINVNKIVEDAKLILSYQIHRYTDHFRMELAEDLPLALGKPQQIEQVVINLIMNALQALPDKGAGITIATMADHDSPGVIVAVRDEGEGMPREVLDRITEPFFSTRLERGGTGLGLSISAAIIREHNGTLAFESTPGGGTTATVTLPMAYPIGDRSND
uniref:histidine kinase n=1 Tax=Geobacter metallireducens TaxID=28232 RepID=A0A831UEW4_GEOME